MSPGAFASTLASTSSASASLRSRSSTSASIRPDSRSGGSVRKALPSGPTCASSVCSSDHKATMRVRDSRSSVWSCVAPCLAFCHSSTHTLRADG